MSSTAIGILLTCVTSLMYGVYAPAARGAYIEGANVVFVILLTTFMRGGGLFLWCVVKKIPLFTTAQDTVNAFKCGFVQALSIVGNIGALMYLPAPVAVMILFTSTLMLLFYMIWRKEMESNRWLILTTFTTLIGLTFVINLWYAQGEYHILGYGFAILGAVATATRLYVFGKLMKSKPPIAIGAETFVTAFVFLGLLMIYQIPIAPQTMQGWWFVALSGLGLTVGSFTMFWAISRIGPFYFSLYNKIDPIWGAVFSVILLHEVLKPGQYIGVVIVIASLVSYQIWDHRHQKRTTKAG
ncbi:MAG: DMT family transporter [Alphaproteobacteria bacterium]|nr:DMT family transporter [Alphaproteobacteria bacterium]